jgi:hypothetical protein
MIITIILVTIMISAVIITMPLFHTPKNRTIVHTKQSYVLYEAIFDQMGRAGRFDDTIILMGQRLINLGEQSKHAMYDSPLPDTAAALIGYSCFICPETPSQSHLPLTRTVVHILPRT